MLLQASNKLVLHQSGTLGAESCSIGKRRRAAETRQNLQQEGKESAERRHQKPMHRAGLWEGDEYLQSPALYSRLQEEKEIVLRQQPCAPGG